MAAVPTGFPGMARKAITAPTTLNASQPVRISVAIAGSCYSSWLRRRLAWFTGFSRLSGCSRHAIRVLTVMGHWLVLLLLEPIIRPKPINADRNSFR